MALPGTGRAVLSRFLSLSSASPLARLSRPLSAVAWQQQDRRSALGRAAAVAAVAAAAALALQDRPTAQCDGGKGFKEQTVSNYEDRIRNFSTPDKVFRYFATVSIDGTPYMQPEDFVRAVTPGELQPEELRLDIFDRKPANYGKVVSKQRKGRLFEHDANGQMTSCKDRGLISYNEFLFLLAALSAPPRQFHLAFKMFDLDGNGVVDIEEFGLVQQAVQSQTSTGRRLHTMSSAAISEELLERSQMLQRFFGANGKGKLTFDSFKEFLDEVQEDVLHLDFIRHNSNNDKDVITELDLAHLMLKYTRIKDKEQTAYITRLKDYYGDQPSTGIKFAKVSEFFKCMRMIDDIDMALSLFTASGSGLTSDVFLRAARAATGVELAPEVVKFVFVFFDKDGDGELHHDEFIRIMKDARSRGLNHEKDLPVGRGFKALVWCIKQRMQSEEE